MPTRFWEIGLGALVFAALRQPQLVHWIQRIPAGLILVVIKPAVTDFGVKTTMAVVMVTALLLACLRPSTPTYKLLSLPAIRFIGLISFAVSLALARAVAQPLDHWPSSLDRSLPNSRDGHFGDGVLPVD
ncbi:MAG: hypothetical protein VKP70_06895 [Cyanobacteriota bacterium]|nr:hypothetical protein [Cyanobacteriota bacterium]